MKMLSYGGYAIPESEFLYIYSQVDAQHRSLNMVHEIIKRFGKRVATNGN